MAYFCFSWYAGGLMNSFYLTQEKKDALEMELNELKTIRRHEISEEVQAAHALGDIPENAEYEAARERQAKNEGRISYLEHILSHSVIITASEHGVVARGSRVVLKAQSGEELELVVTGDIDEGVGSGKISPASPLGLALLGKRAGDQVSVQTPRGKVEYEIVATFPL